jgi:hypothetical protein
VSESCVESLTACRQTCHARYDTTLAGTFRADLFCVNFQTGEAKLEDYADGGPNEAEREGARRMLQWRMVKQGALASKDTAKYTCELARYTRAIARGTVALFVVTGLSLIVQLVLALMKK